MKKAVIALVALVVLVVGALVVRILVNDAPEAVSLEDVAENAAELSDTEGQTDEAADPEPAVEIDDINGIWSINTEAGEFDFETATGSFVGFRIDEELTIGEVTAVGRTDQVSGSFEVADNVLSAAEISVQVVGFTTNDSRRDSHVRDALNATEFPEATFALAEPIELDADSILANESFSVEAAGELTMAGVTNAVVFQIDGQLVDEFIVLAGSTSVVFSDYNVEVPSAPIIVSVEDEGVLEFQLLVERS